MSQSFDVRRFQPDELHTYKEIRLNALRESPDAFGSTYENSVKFTDEQWRTRFESAFLDENCALVAVAGSKAVGLAWGMIESPRSGEAHLYSMWVDPAYRNWGIGRALVDSVLVWARSQEVARIVLEVTCGNDPARRLYESFGFAPIGKPFPLREGSPLLEQTMELAL